MKIILTKDVSGTGQAGDVRDVADGFARNYLLPRRLAVHANSRIEAQVTQQRSRQRQREEREVVDARALAAKLEASVLRITARAGERGKLYGAVVNIDVAEAAEAQLGVTLDRRHIEFEPAHETGEHLAVVRLHSSVEAKLRVEVVPT
ncbi:MAG TPA: 50S ribosomal protein L9 [Candidatus Micrarchaeia archaeon]|nr:50S ribosomal protein L9 [Candidatus Micrarchaeia archaeon]